MWIHFFRPKGTGRIEFSSSQARLLLNSSRYIPKGGSAFPRVERVVASFGQRIGGQDLGQCRFHLLVDHIQQRSAFSCRKPWRASSITSCWRAWASMASNRGPSRPRFRRKSKITLPLGATVLPEYKLGDSSPALPHLHFNRRFIDLDIAAP